MNNGDLLISFYLGSGSDNRGRTLDEILTWGFDKLEYTHDYIQWLFPLDTNSAFNSEAPILTLESIEKFKQSRELKKRIGKSFKLLLDFYGFELSDTTVMRTDNYVIRTSNWLNSGNHNLLRISRILRSLKLLGCEVYSQSFFNALNTVYKENCTDIGDSYKYWKEAVGQP